MTTLYVGDKKRRIIIDDLRTNLENEFANLDNIQLVISDFKFTHKSKTHLWSETLNDTVCQNRSLTWIRFIPNKIITCKKCNSFLEKIKYGY